MTSGYRDPDARAERSFQRRALLGCGRAWMLVLLLPCVFLPATLVPCRAEARCRVATDTCTVDVVPVLPFFGRHETFAMRDVTSAHIEGQGKQRALVLDHGSIGWGRIKDESGVTTGVVLQALRAFIADPSADVDGEHTSYVVASLLIALGIVLGLVMVGALLAPFEVRVRDDGEELHVWTRRFPLPPRTSVFAVDTVKGARERRYLRKTRNGETEMATIDLVVGSGGEDIVDRQLPVDARLTALAHELDGFVRGAIAS